MFHTGDTTQIIGNQDRTQDWIYKRFGDLSTNYIKRIGRLRNGLIIRDQSNLYIVLVSREDLGSIPCEGQSRPRKNSVGIAADFRAGYPGCASIQRVFKEDVVGYTGYTGEIIGDLNRVQNRIGDRFGNFRTNGSKGI